MSLQLWHLLLQIGCSCCVITTIYSCVLLSVNHLYFANQVLGYNRFILVSRFRLNGVIQGQLYSLGGNGMRCLYSSELQRSKRQEAVQHLCFPGKAHRGNLPEAEERR
jgi:hypothetical protein